MRNFSIISQHGTKNSFADNARSMGPTLQQPSQAPSIRSQRTTSWRSFFTIPSMQPLTKASAALDYRLARLLELPNARLLKKQDLSLISMQNLEKISQEALNEKDFILHARAQSYIGYNFFGTFLNTRGGDRSHYLERSYAHYAQALTVLKNIGDTESYHRIRESASLLVKILDHHPAPKRLVQDFSKLASAPYTTNIAAEGATNRIPQSSVFVQPNTIEKKFQRARLRGSMLL